MPTQGRRTLTPAVTVQPFLGPPGFCPQISFSGLCLVWTLPAVMLMLSAKYLALFKATFGEIIETLQGGGKSHWLVSVSLKKDK